MKKSLDKIKKIFEVYENPSRCDFKSGDFIDQYKIEKKLGEGAFGIVFLVEDVEEMKKYALKLLRLWEIAYESEKKELQKRFVREYHVAQTESEYLVRSIDCGRIKGNPWFTMEYCSGGTLFDWLGNRAHDILEINKSAHRVLLGLQALHLKGYFHRDLKPQNVLFNELGLAKLTDFGIAGHKISRLTALSIFGKTEQIFGTWAYIAPEQANNHKAFKALDAVTDIYSFGVTMFEVFTGQLPFPPFSLQSEHDIVEYLKNAKLGNWENLELKRSLLPGNWYSIIKGAIEPDYNKKRFQNVSEIISLLGYKSNQNNLVIHDTLKNDIALQIVYGAEMNKIYNLSELVGKNKMSGLLTLGRKDSDFSNSIEIIEENPVYISRQHLTIEKLDQGSNWRIRDGQWLPQDKLWKESTNGTYINSKRVSSAGQIIKSGDLITIGDTTIKVIVI
jgi:serine/threonine protein kinase